jgi:hypothetical protein
MSQDMTRREFVKESVFAAAAVAAGLKAGANAAGPESPAPTAKIGGGWTGKLGNLELSRLMLGGNLIAGWAHARDLRYVGNLMCRYNTPEKIVETLEIAHQHGINSINTTAWDNIEPLKTYWKKHGKNVKWVVSVKPVPMADNPFEEIDQVVRDEADVIYLWGGAADGLVKKNQFDWIKRTLERMRATGRPIGIGAHTLRVVVECEKAGLDFDFYQKTLHTRNYPTAQRPEEKDEFGSYDNAWCYDAAEVVEVMKNVKKPWIAFKVMAAGAIPPQEAFQYAVDSGADFVLAGMFDWQIAQDVKIFKQVLEKNNRTRPWRA